MKRPVPPADAPRQAAEICRQFTLSPRARPLLGPGQTVREFMAELVREGLYADAIRCLVYRLPVRQAVWWGGLCARHLGGRPLPPAQEAALQATVRWVLEPSEEHRRAARALADAATLRTLAGCLALGVFFTGSPAPDRKPPAPPRPELAPRVIAGGILQAASSAKTLPTPDAQKQLLALGMQTFLGQAPWS